MPQNAFIFYSELMGITQFEIVPTSPVYESIFTFDEEAEAETANFE